MTLSRHELSRDANMVESLVRIAKALERIAAATQENAAGSGATVVVNAPEQVCPTCGAVTEQSS